MLYQLQSYSEPQWVNRLREPPRESFPSNCGLPSTFRHWTAQKILGGFLWLTLAFCMGLLNTGPESLCRQEKDDDPTPRTRTVTPQELPRGKGNPQGHHLSPDLKCYQRQEGNCGSVLCVKSTQKNWSHPLTSQLGMITESALGQWSPVRPLTQPKIQGEEAQ